MTTVRLNFFFVSTTTQTIKKQYYTDKQKLNQDNNHNENNNDNIISDNSDGFIYGSSENRRNNDSEYKIEGCDNEEKVNIYDEVNDDLMDEDYEQDNNDGILHSTGDFIVNSGFEIDNDEEYTPEEKEIIDLTNSDGEYQDEEYEDEEYEDEEYEDEEDVDIMEVNVVRLDAFALFQALGLPTNKLATPTISEQD